MADRQQHGNREMKKPKKQKPKSVANSSGSIWETVEKVHPTHGTASKK